MNPNEHLVKVPPCARPRCFLRRKVGNEFTTYPGGWTNKKDALDWIREFGSYLDWQVGYEFSLKGDRDHSAIVDKRGKTLKI